jgi:hypothetical protein
VIKYDNNHYNKEHETRDTKSNFGQNETETCIFIIMFVKNMLKDLNIGLIFCTRHTLVLFWL